MSTGKLNIISGCPRSGTSIMSLCILSSIGEDRLIGKKFPMQRKDPLSKINKIKRITRSEANKFIYTFKNEKNPGIEFLNNYFIDFIV